MVSRQQFSPLCDVHHTSMRRVMLEEDSEEIRSCHLCDRPGCMRAFRAASGYSDMIDSRFDESCASLRACPVCGAALYLLQVDHQLKQEDWECPCRGCEYSEQTRSPASR